MAMAHRAASYFFDAQDLHYGYWRDELPVHLRNLSQAQEAYSAALISDLPDDAESILDVGCGAGATARRLAARGYSVDCVTPPGPLAEIAAERLGGDLNLFVTPFQAFESPRTYDLILFSESILFIRPLEAAIAKAVSLLRDRGYILVCDIFRRPHEGPKYHGGLGGGHYIDDWHRTLGEFPLELLKEVDITDRIAPTFAVLEQIMDVMHPVYRLFLDRLRLRRPWATRLLARVLNLPKYERKLFGGRYSAENFRSHKLYYRFLYRLSQPAAALS